MTCVTRELLIEREGAKPALLEREGETLEREGAKPALLEREGVALEREGANPALKRERA